MKKILSLMLIFVILFSVAGCFKNPNAKYAPYKFTCSKWVSKDGVFFFEVNEQRKCFGTMTIDGIEHEVYFGIFASKPTFGVVYMEDYENPSIGPYETTYYEYFIIGQPSFKKNKMTVKIKENTIKDQYDVKTIVFTRVDINET